MCRSCQEARAKLLAGYPGQAAALAARTLWWKARRGRDKADRKPPKPKEAADGRS